MVTGAESPAIACDGVVKRFGSVVALDRLSFEVARGRVVGFLGPNGAGKSTTIRILLDLARADAGTVTVMGVDPRRARPQARRSIGYLPGELRLDERLSVAETFRSWSRLRGGTVDQAYVAELCERLDLDPGRETKGLSSGNRRKVGLVGAFMARPQLLVLDEPTSGLDPLVQAEFAEMVDDASEAGATVFLSSHVLSEVQRIAEDVVVVRGGRVVSAGSVTDMRHLARQPFRATFHGEPPVAELRAVPGLLDVDVHGSEVTGFVSGPPAALLGVLAQHRVDTLLMPEPDLEDAFMRLYGIDGGEPG